MEASVSSHVQQKWACLKGSYDHINGSKTQIQKGKKGSKWEKDFD